MLLYRLVEDAGLTDERQKQLTIARDAALQVRHRLNGYLAQQVPSFLFAGSFGRCLNCEVLKGMFPWRTRYTLS